MTPTTEQPDPASSSDEEMAEARAGQSTTAEEAMDAATHEEGFAEESSYTPSPGNDDDPMPDSAGS